MKKTILIPFILLVAFITSAQGDDCINATPISCGDILMGNTSGFTADVAPFCVVGDGTGGGVWYSVLGDGNDMTTSLCPSSYDTRVRVFTGTCGALICEVGNDDACGGTSQSQVTWTSVPGVTYYILIHGFGAATGDYLMKFICVTPPPPPPPNCFVQTVIAYQPDPYAGTQVFLGDDVHSGVVPIGFDFCYFGADYNQCVISSNNYITFDLFKAFAWSPWATVPVPTTTPIEVMNSVLSPWQDVNPGVGGAIYYQTIGSAPNRRFVVSFENVPMFSCTGILYNSQIILREGSNCFETHIADKVFCPTWNNGNSVHGIHDGTGLAANIYPGRNNTAWNATAEGTLWTPDCAPCMTASSPTCYVSPLPIELLEFVGHSELNTNVLEWSTASETNNALFVVERTLNGTSFEQIATVEGAGTTESGHTYRAIDDLPINGNNYYRLKQIDFDGETTYSDLISINNKEQSQVFVYPSPSNTNITVALAAQPKKSASAIIRSTLGKKMFVSGINGKKEIIDVSFLPNGVYFIEVIVDGKGRVLKFSKN